MTAEEFQEGAKVCSPYAAGDHYANPSRSHSNLTQVDPMAVGVIGPIEYDGWADVIYPDGYRLQLDATRCILLAPAEVAS